MMFDFLLMIAKHALLFSAFLAVCYTLYKLISYLILSLIDQFYRRK